MSLAPESFQLLVIDVQEKLYAAMPEKAREVAHKSLDNLVFLCRALHVPVTFTEQYSKGLGPTLASLGATDVFEKMAFAATDEPGFEERLQRGKRFLLTGMETHICVAHTALGLRAAGHDVWVIPDACVSRRKEDWETGLSWMASEGVRVVPCESVLFGLVGSAGGPIFKEISRRIR